MEEQYDNLKKQAKSLGVPTNSGVYKPRDQAWNELAITEYELHRRIKEEKRHRREHRLFWIAIISMVISLISASAAWYLVFEKSTG